MCPGVIDTACFLFIIKVQLTADVLRPFQCCRFTAAANDTVDIKLLSK